MEEDKKKVRLKSIFVLLLILFVGGVFTLHILPRGIAKGFDLLTGVNLDSHDLATRYGMGIISRLIGLAILLPVFFRLNVMKNFTYRITGTCFVLSWMFFVYIVANLEVDGMKYATPQLILLMVLECFVIGFYEEILFRGVLLRQFMELFEDGQGKYMCAVLTSSLAFALVHLMNLFTGARIEAVLSQVVYTFILGIAFSALLIRTNWNLLWCGLIHSLYDMASGFGDFAVLQQTENVTVSPQTVNAGAYLINLCLFIPLLLYGIFLLRKRNISV